ncbi:MAG: hypothetical protein ACXWN5_03930 [Candidatus Limnocylindrales bacterium]
MNAERATAPLDSADWALAHLHDPGVRFVEVDVDRAAYGKATSRVPSAGTGRASSAMASGWFVLHELLGYPRVRNYDGSWTEWGSLVGVPIERGAPTAS